MNQYRTHTCGQLRVENVGETVKIAGWIHRKRNLGNLCFIDLRRDRSRNHCWAMPISHIVLNNENRPYAALFTTNNRT